MRERRAPCATNLERVLVSYLRFALCCSIFLSWVAPAFAHTVALLRPPSHPLATTELLERLRGELLSLGFEVVLRDRLAGSESTAIAAKAWQRELAADGEVDAAIDVVGEVSPARVDVWIIDRAGRFQLVTRLALEANTENASKRLAIRASEVLRARLFETHLAAGERRPALVLGTSTASALDAERAGSEPARHLGVELGAAVQAGLDGVGPALVPIGRIDWAFDSGLAFEATFAGFGSRPIITTSAGSARVAVQYGLAGGAYRLNWSRWFKPLGALSLGALRSAVEGRAESPREGHSLDRWSFLLDASLGAVFEISRHYSLTLAAHAQLAEPYVAIRFADRQVASLGRPNLLLALTIGGWP